MSLLRLALVLPVAHRYNKQIICGAMLAVRHVNERQRGVVADLPELASSVTIEATLHDTFSTEAGAVAGYRNGTQRGAHAMVGAARSAATTILAILGVLDDVPQCSHWSTSPALSSGQLYPLFSRTHPSDDVTTLALPRVVASLGWRSIGIIYSGDDGYSSSYADGVRLNAAAAGVEVVVSATYEYGNPSSFGAALTLLRDSRVNVILACVFDVDIVEMLRQAEAMGIYGAGYAWITTDATTIEAAEAGTSSEARSEARRLMSGLLNFAVSPRGTAGFERLVEAWAAAPAATCDNGLFDSDAPGLLGGAIGSEGVFPVAAYAFDCVVAFAAAASSAGGAEDGARLASALRASAFEGASGLVRFDGVGDRVADSVSFSLDHWRAAAGGGPLETVHVRVYANLTGGISEEGGAWSNVTWPGGVATIPTDRYDLSTRTYVPRGLIHAAMVVVLLCLIVGLGFVCWIYLNRKAELVKASQPGFLYLVVLGSLLSISALAPAAVDHHGWWELATRSDEAAAEHPVEDLACSLQVWLYCVGFAISFGSLLAKVYHVMLIVNRSTSLARHHLTRKLTLGVVALALGQAALLAAWHASAPPKYVIIVKRLANGVKVQSYGQCDMGGAAGRGFMYSILGLQAALLLAGNVLCWKARQIPTAYAETKFITFSVGSHLQTKLIAVLAAAFTAGSSSPTTLFLVKFLALALSDFGTLLLMWIPKAMELNGPGAEQAMTDAKRQLFRLAIERKAHGLDSELQRSSQSAQSGGQRSSISNPEPSIVSQLSIASRPSAAAQQALQGMDAQAEPSLAAQASFSEKSMYPCGVGMMSHAASSSISMSARASSSQSSGLSLSGRDEDAAEPADVEVGGLDRLRKPASK